MRQKPPRASEPTTAGKLPVVITSLLLLCGLLAGCGAKADGAPGGKIELQFSWWGNADRAEVTNEAVELFERRNPGIEVQTSFSSYNSYIQKLATQAAGGNAPDVMQLDYRQISQYASAGLLLDLDDRPSISTGEVTSAMLRTGQANGEQYAIPMGRTSQVMVYDSARWQRAGVPEPEFGWTWRDWSRAMRQLGEATDRTGATDPGWSEDWFEVWLRGRGKSLYTDRGGLNYDAADLARFWRTTNELSQRGAVSPARQTTQIDGSAANMPFGRGNALSGFTWDSAVGGFQALIGDSLRLAPLPVGPDGTPGQYFKPSMLVGVSADSPHPEAASKLVDFLINDPRAGEILGVSRGLPVNRTIREKITPSLTGLDERIAEFQESLDGELLAPPSAPPQGDLALQTAFQRDYDHVGFELQSPRKTAEQFLTNARSELQR
ncbi:sugar ABC transporter substrate-binding protein [Actinopolyspora erythraea]|uniref:Sugar ABC transporter substrate-binding protein n=1 Tax=Actinopolyspora erythraea TaxID=414996 RepID=A0A223RSN6_9ACTN|nr:extracellular solute-binding protein [Actinopolyspora erythraea]ASU78860.1 sugar ABC transporter substrate-binding protein [Actinopolyspora erythraea]